MQWIKPEFDNSYVCYIPIMQLWTKEDKKDTLYITKYGGASRIYSYAVDIAYSLEDVDKNLTVWQRALIEEMNKHGWTRGELIIKEAEIQRETLRDFIYTTIERE